MHRTQIFREAVPPLHVGLAGVFVFLICSEAESSANIHNGGHAHILEGIVGYGDEPAITECVECHTQSYCCNDGDYEREPSMWKRAGKKYMKGRREELKLVSGASAIIYVLDPDTEPTQTEEKI